MAAAHELNCLCGRCLAERRGELRRRELEEARRLRELPMPCQCGCGRQVVAGAELRAYAAA